MLEKKTASMASFEPLHDVQAMVLAAGYGQRLQPITQHLPKPLLPVGAHPLVAYSLSLLAYYGFKDVFINSHHLSKVLKEHLKEGSAYGLNLHWSDEVELLGTGGALKRLAEHIKQTLIVINSDILVDIDLAIAWKRHRQSEALATMLLHEDPLHPQAGRIVTDGYGKVVSVPGEHRLTDKNITTTQQPYVFTGIHILERRFLEYLPPEIHHCVIRYGYSKAIANGEKIAYQVLDGYWRDVGVPHEYWQANSDALEQRLKLQHIDPLGGYALSPRRNVAEVVRMGSDVDFDGSSYLQPPLLIGDRVRMGAGVCLGPAVVLGKDVVVGKDSVLKNCVVLDGSKIEPGSRIENTLLLKKHRLSLLAPE